VRAIDGHDPGLKSEHSKSPVFVTPDDAPKGRRLRHALSD
jgi:hypothetical protein